MWWYVPAGAAAWGLGYEAWRNPGYAETAAVAFGTASVAQTELGAFWMRYGLYHTGHKLHMSARAAGQIGKHTIGKAAAWIIRTNAVRSAGGLALRGSAAVAVPIAAGYAVSYGIAGKSGAADFHDYITGGVSPKKWWDTVTLKSMR